MSSLKLSELAAQLGGQVLFSHDAATVECSTARDPIISDALPLQDASPGCITLVDHPKHLDRLHASAAAAVMTAKPLDGCRLPQVLVADLHAGFQQAICRLRPHAACQPVSRGVHPTSQVAVSASVGAETSLGPGVVVGEDCRIGEHCVIHAGVQIMAGCQLGDHCELFPHVTLYPHTRLGHRVLIHAGAVLGAYGFGYRQQDGHHRRTAQLGWVEVEDDVEIGANTTIDRGTYGATRIGTGTKIDNLVQIGHNCHIGSHNLICAQVGIAGSTTTGAYVVLAGQAGLADHLRLADRVVVAAQSGVMHDVAEGEVVFGSPSQPRRQRMVEIAHVNRLPAMRQELKALQAQVALLQQQNRVLTHSG